MKDAEKLLGIDSKDSENEEAESQSSSRDPRPAVDGMKVKDEEDSLAVESVDVAPPTRGPARDRQKNLRNTITLGEEKAKPKKGRSNSSSNTRRTLSRLGMPS
eukprot:TRINITY_DN25919_c0_g1_i1.p1 TRINITY_DN25919_c0_g1~~TRINITY_DN25919_c0_g1_i1.p1  ORF type:complete len:103 (+),score=27.09 TRINITY_DN25919_c0_g1_i1:117-425(+)